MLGNFPSIRLWYFQFTLCASPHDSLVLLSHIRLFLKTPLAGGLSLFWQMLVSIRASFLLIALAQLQLLLQKNCGPDMPTIMKAAGWSNASTFALIYHKPIQQSSTAAFSKAILSNA